MREWRVITWATCPKCRCILQMLLEDDCVKSDVHCTLCDFKGYARILEINDNDNDKDIE